MERERERIVSRADRAHLEEESTFALARDLLDRVTLLARKEIELARAEMKVDAERGKTAGKLGGTAAVFGIAALSLALLTIVLALGYVMPAWLASLVGFGLFALGGGFLAAMTYQRAKEAQPRRSIREAQMTVKMFQGFGHMQPRHP